MNDSGTPNPFAIEALRPVENVQRPLNFAWYIGLIFVAAASLVVRFWRAGSVERQQIKWFTYTASLAASGALLDYTISEALDVPLLGWIGKALVFAGLVGIPVSMGVAILRYRLYDIDIIINRTLVYGLLTTSLALVYFGGVATTQTVFRAFTGQESNVAIVASTLAIAALFVPLRRRIQDAIDRRFYRRHYDASRICVDFSARLRDETKLEVVSHDLVDVVRRTVQPEHVSLWLREPDREGGWTN